jgi:2-polyprenyl-3-methyl-5-hydroxy-6-metoxy-1,4-benzoquinol methylase
MPSCMYRYACYVPHMRPNCKSFFNLRAAKTCLNFQLWHHANLMARARSSKLRGKTLSIGQISAALRQPRAREGVYHDYNLLRQRYILERCAKHYKVRDDDPAPLYNKTLLDVGCGESPIGQFLALSGADITAIDRNPEAIAIAEAAAVSFGAPITFHAVGQ